MKLKRIIAACQILLCIAVVLFFLLKCFVVDVYGSFTWKYTGFEAYLGQGSKFKPSVGGVMTLIFLGIVLVSSCLKIFLPKLSLIWNIINVFFLIFVFIFLCSGANQFMINSTQHIIEKYKKVADIKIGVGTILGIITTFICASASVAEEIITRRNK